MQVGGAFFTTDEVQDMRDFVAHHERMMQMFEELQTKVAAMKDAEASAAALLGGLKAKLDAAIAQLPNADDKARLQAISDSLDAQTADLAAAVVANTPAADA